MRSRRTDTNGWLVLVQIGELTTLWLADGELEEDALGELIAGLRQNTVLKSLYLHGKCLTDAAIEELVGALLKNQGAQSSSALVCGRGLV